MPQKLILPPGHESKGLNIGVQERDGRVLIQFSQSVQTLNMPVNEAAVFHRALGDAINHAVNKHRPSLKGFN